MTAFIEYDRSPDLWRHWANPTAPLPAAFSAEAGTPYSVSLNGSVYTGSKDYLFFAAIAGIRDTQGRPSLFEPRGNPSNPSPEVEARIKSFGVGAFGVGWLFLSEIEEALQHHQIDPTRLSFETQTILDILRSLVARLGDDRVRLVFGFD